MRPKERLRLLVCSDLRSHDLDEFVAWVAQRSQKPDLIVYAGDDVMRFRDRVGRRNYWSRLAELSTYGLVAVEGNDTPSVESHRIAGRKVYDLGRRSLVLGDFVFHGLPSAEKPDYGHGLYLTGDALDRITESRARWPARTSVLVSHSPPWGVLDQAIRFSPNGEPISVGSVALRWSMAAHHDLRLVCAGHVHHDGGQHRWVDGTLVVNAASHDDRSADCRIAEIVLTHRGTMPVRWHRLQLPHILEHVVGIGDYNAGLFRNAGIRTARALANTTTAQAAAALGYHRNPGAAARFVADARAHVEGRPVVFDSLDLPRRPRWLIDVETDRTMARLWMLTLLDERTGRYRQLLAVRDKDEYAVLQSLSRLLIRTKRPILEWSGSSFDRRALTAAFARAKLPVPMAVETMVDAHQAARASIALPVSSWRLESLAAWVGFAPRHSDLSGQDVADLCTRYRNQGRPAPAKVREYNVDDVRTFALLLRRLELVASRQGPPHRPAREAARPPISPLGGLR
jgi:Icc-related predicted phosphoesterase